MSTKYKFHDQDELYFLSYAVVYWIDLFTRNEYKNIVLSSWEYCREHKGMDLYGYCFMTSHIHMIIGTHQAKMEDIMRDMKTHTSKQLRKAINEHPTESRRECLSRHCVEKLRRVEQAEAILLAEGFRHVRVRDHGDIARIEMAGDEFSRLNEPAVRAHVSASLREIGFRFVCVDLEGYRSGGISLS